MQNKSSRFLKLKTKPYELFGLIALLFFVISLFSSHRDIDINLHDTYIVISKVNIYRILVVLFLFIWSIYIFSHRILLANTLTWLHVAFTVLPIFIFFLTQHPAQEGPPRRYYAFSEFEHMKPAFNWVLVWSIAFLILLFGQLFLLINLFGGLLKTMLGITSKEIKNKN